MENRKILALIYLGFLLGFIVGALFVDWAYTYNLTKCK